MTNWWKTKEGRLLRRFGKDEINNQTIKKSAPDDPHWLEQLLSKHEKPFNLEKLTPEEREELKVIILSGANKKPENKRQGKQVFSGANAPNLLLLVLGDNLITELTIKDCPNLKYLVVSHNLLTKLTFENCPNLTDLYTHHNQFTDATFPDPKQFPKLENLTFYDPDYKPKKKSEVSEEEEPADTDYKGNLLSPEKVQELEQYCQQHNIKLEVKPFFPLLSAAEQEKADLILRALKGEKKENLSAEELKILTETKELDLTELVGREDGKRINGRLYLDLFPNLERLICNNQNITGTLDLSFCPNLKFVYCNNNWIEEINLAGLDKLEEFYCSGNEFSEKRQQFKSKLSIIEWGKGINELDLTQTPNLKSLECHDNPIKELEIQHLTKLESLKCFKCNLEELDVSNLKNLKELHCANNGYKEYDAEISIGELKVQGCESLEVLDCAENGLKELDISNLTKLKTVSCKENFIRIISADNCKSLEYINFSKWRKEEEFKGTIIFTFKNCHKLKKFFLPTPNINFNILQTPNLKTLTFGRVENDEKLEEDIPALRQQALEKIRQEEGEEKYQAAVRAIADRKRKKERKARKKRNRQKDLQATNLGYYNYHQAISPQFNKYFHQGISKEEALVRIANQLLLSRIATLKAFLSNLISKPNYSLAQAQHWNTLLWELSGETITLPPPTPTPQPTPTPGPTPEPQAESGDTPTVWPWVVLSGGVAGVIVLGVVVWRRWRRKIK